MKIPIPRGDWKVAVVTKELRVRAARGAKLMREELARFDKEQRQRPNTLPHERVGL